MSDPSPQPDAHAGRIGKRVLMPIGMWSEILEIAKEGGADHRDVLLQLLDLGIQAQDTDRFKPRWLPVEGPVRDQVAAFAAQSGVSEDKALVQLLDLGLQIKAEETAAARPRPVPEGMLVRIESSGKDLGAFRSRAVPGRDEVVTVQGRHYVVTQRAWSAGGQELVAYLRVKPYGGTHG